jgi:D-citramalate synthase|tara:strand:- start:950 stop:2440 length:1491 start_codon:yes stop_codon:yes gene_type:complete
VKFLDTTLRDGEQTPGISLTPEKKLSVARAIDTLGVEVIEAGFACISQGEFNAVKLVANEGLDAEVCSATRGVITDIDAAIQAGVDSVNIIIPSSDLHIETKLRKTREEVLDITAAAVTHSKDHGLVAEISAEDGSRADREYLKILAGRAFEAGLDRMTICDTVGTLTPGQSFDLYSEMRGAFPGEVLGVHCHNDFGLGVANSIFALGAGIDIVHVTVNGIGERAGNTALEEIVVALKILYNRDTSVRMEKLTSVSRMVSHLTGMPVQANKAIVGANAFAHESGIHTHAISKDPTTYEAINPELVGAARRMVSGKHAGSTGLLKSLVEMGLQPSKAEFGVIMARVKNLGDSGKGVTDADLLDFAEEAMGLRVEPRIILNEYTVTTGNRITPTASVKMRLDGVTVIEESTGNGPVDATLNAVSKALPQDQQIQLDTYHVEAITGGTNAVVNVEVRLRRGNRIVNSTGVHEDIVQASIEAYLRGMNVLLVNDKNSDTT